MAQKRLDDSNIGTALQQVGRKTVAQRVQRHALTARAQQGERMRRIGVLMSNVESDPEVQTWMAAFREGLRKLGWVQDRNIRIDARWGAADYERLRIYAAELSRLAPDVIFAGATPALVALQRETSSLPIVFTQVSDPVKLGLIASLARPGGNITGFAIVEHAIAGKWLELLKDTASGTTRILVLSDPNTPSHGPCLSNIFLHHVLDEWFEFDVRPRLKGRCTLIRFADDAVLGHIYRRSSRRRHHSEYN